MSWELDQLQALTLDVTRAWQGTVQIYSYVFKQPMTELLGDVKCSVLAPSSIDGVLNKYIDIVKIAVSHIKSIIPHLKL